MPRITNLALNLSISPVELCFTLKIHLLSIAFLPSGKFTNYSRWFFWSDDISLSIASIHFLFSKLLRASWYDFGSLDCGKCSHRRQLKSNFDHPDLDSMLNRLHRLLFHYFGIVSSAPWFTMPLQIHCLIYQWPIGSVQEILFNWPRYQLTDPGSPHSDGPLVNDAFSDGKIAKLPLDLCSFEWRS